jgi:L-Ala-D/L-Glu epimerase
VRGEDVEGLAWVRARVGLPVMADEAVFTMTDLNRVARLGAADHVNVKLAKCGSLRTALALLRRAEELGLGTMVGSMMESAIGVGAIASVVAAHPTTLVDDLDAAWWAAASPLVGGPTYAGDRIVLSARPGLGVEDLARSEPNLGGD